MNLDLILVLNVKSFTDRRIFMQEQLQKFGLHAEFVLDGDVDDLTDTVIKSYFTGSKLTTTQQSCALKHVIALQKIVEHQCTFALVLEDDAVFGKDLNSGINRALAQSADFPGDKVIYIGSGGNFFTPKSLRKKGRYLYPGHRGRFADSYIIDSQTAQKRLRWIQENKIELPIDNQFDLMDKALNIQILWLEDPVVEQGSKSGLFRSSLERDLPPWLKFLTFRLEKLRRKYIYQLWR